MRFHGFACISRVGGLPTVKGQAVGSKDTFARSWPAAISSIFIDFTDFHMIALNSIDFKVKSLPAEKG